jgi:hypothetical protein
VLRHALEAGYAVGSLDEFVLGDLAASDRVLILRHDVDQAPRSVLPMLRIEQRHGVLATWYFRWRTADPRIVGAVRAAGGSIGLHYETLTRQILARGQPHGEAERAAMLDACRALLRAEIRAFNASFGLARSAAAHGDTRVPGVNNGDLLRDQDPHDFGLEFDANVAMRRFELACWLTDRSASDGSWKDGLDPLDLLAAGQSPILCLTHPNNWISGVRLWIARGAHAVRREGDRPPL